MRRVVNPAVNHVRHGADWNTQPPLRPTFPPSIGSRRPITAFPIRRTFNLLYVRPFTNGRFVSQWLPDLQGPDPMGRRSKGPVHRQRSAGVSVSRTAWGGFLTGRSVPAG